MSNEPKYTFSLHVDGVEFKEVNPFDLVKLLECLFKMLDNKSSRYMGVEKVSIGHSSSLVVIA